VGCHSLGDYVPMKEQTVDLVEVSWVIQAESIVLLFDASLSASVDVSGVVVKHGSPGRRSIKICVCLRDDKDAYHRVVVQS
jgi:hypothetical protein